VRVVILFVFSNREAQVRNKRGVSKLICKRRRQMAVFVSTSWRRDEKLNVATWFSLSGEVSYL